MEGDVVQELAGLKPQGLAPAAPAEAPPTRLSAQLNVMWESRCEAPPLLPEPAGVERATAREFIWFGIKGEELKDPSSQRGNPKRSQSFISASVTDN